MRIKPLEWTPNTSDPNLARMLHASSTCGFLCITFLHKDATLSHPYVVGHQEHKTKELTICTPTSKFATLEEAKKFAELYHEKCLKCYLADE